MALTQLKTGAIADDAVTTDKLANAINTARDANTAKASITINNNADNRVMTGSDTANTFEGEANLTFDGTSLLTVHVPSATGEPALNFTNSDTGTGTGNGFGLGINSSESPYIWNRENTDLRIATNNSERLRINSSGDVGIGTTSPAERLHVYEASDAAVIRLEPGHSNGQAFNILSTYGSAANTGNFSIRNESGSSFLDLQHNEGTPRMQIRNGTANVHAQIDADGIKFNGDTAAANGLDDYEEGTFTPEYNSGSAASACMASGVAYSAQVGIYRKIGNMVFFQIKIEASSATAKSGQLIITGLPFTSGNFSSNATAGGGVISLTGAFSNTDHMPTVFISGSSTLVKFFQTNASNWAGTDLNSATGTLHLTGQYPTT